MKPRAKKAARAALGFRAHSGWAALIAVAGSLRAPIVLERRRVELVEHPTWAAKQPFHAAEKLPLKEAQKIITRSKDEARRLAHRALREALDELGVKGHRVACCGILLGSGRPLTTLETTLASHALIHTAEGEHFREALLHASAKCGLCVTGVKEKELFSRCASAFRISENDLHGRIAAIGKQIGPPWSQDEKFAALAAWLALAALK